MATIRAQFAPYTEAEGLVFMMVGNLWSIGGAMVQYYCPRQGRGATSR